MNLTGTGKVRRHERAEGLRIQPEPPFYVWRISDALDPRQLRLRGSYACAGSARIEHSSAKGRRVPETRRYTLHSSGPALWPEHKPADEIRRLRATTPPHVFATTYQLEATIPGGTIFKKHWYQNGRSRYHPRDPKFRVGGTLEPIRRWISWDTAHTATKKGFQEMQQTAAYSAVGVWDLTTDYRILLRHVERHRIEFPDLMPNPYEGDPGLIARVSDEWYVPGIFAGHLIENADSGTMAIQTLQRASDPWAGEMILAYQPTVDKVTRAIDASTWFMNGSVLLPLPDFSVPWLLEYEQELFGFPNVAYKDQVDMSTQIVNWTANRWLSLGLDARQELGLVDPAWWVEDGTIHQGVQPQ